MPFKLKDIEHNKMTFWEHLEEFRWTLVRILIALTCFTIIGLVFIPRIFDSVILAPKSSDFITYRFFRYVGEYLSFLPDFSQQAFNVKILNLNMQTQFLTYISSSFALAFALTLPYTIYEIWKFVNPALYQNERKNLKVAFVFGGFMFALGCLVGYFIVFPLIFRFLITFELSSQIDNMLSLNSYMSNFYTLIIIMGVVFEMPLVFWLLSKMDLIDNTFFREYRKHAIVSSLVLSAIITPSGDPFSLFVVSLPLYMLWEISSLVVKKKL